MQGLGGFLFVITRGVESLREKVVDKIDAYLKKVLDR